MPSKRVCSIALASMILATGTAFTAQPSTMQRSNQLVPNVGAISGQNIDYGALAARYEDVKRKTLSEGSQDAQIGSGLYVFVSLGMPKPSLSKIVEQAEKAGAVVVLRGMVDRNMVKTANQIKELVGDHKVAFQIDPRLFKIFGIGAVPATVMVEPGASFQKCSDKHCNGNAVFAKVMGDVSLQYALQEIVNRAPESLGSMASAYLARIEN